MSNSYEPLALDTLVFDCTPFEHFLVDLVRRGRLGMLTARDGFVEVVGEIVSNQEELGGQAGITKEDFETWLEAGDRVAMADAVLPALRKLCERMEETRAKEEDKRQRLTHAFADSVEKRARSLGNTKLLARYEKTRAYRSALGLKAAKARAKNAQAASKSASADAAPLG